MISIRVLQICNEDSCGNHCVIISWQNLYCMRSGIPLVQLKVNSRSYMRKGIVFCLQLLVQSESKYLCFVLWLWNCTTKMLYMLLKITIVKFSAVGFGDLLLTLWDEVFGFQIKDPHTKSQKRQLGFTGRDRMSL